MTKRTASNLPLTVALLGMCLVFLLPGCSEKGGGDRVRNLDPDTYISFGPKENSLTYFKVQVYWYGADQDGDIDHFEVTTVKDLGGAYLDTIDLDILPWAPTVSRESTFVLASDSCCLDTTQNPLGLSEYALSVWGILVRAVDNEGRIDRSPASLFFTATNVIPKVAIVVPDKLPIAYMDVPPHPYIEWEGDDPDGDAARMSYKYLIIPENDLNPTYPRLPPLSYEDTTVTTHACPQVGKWSRWVPADCTFVKDLDLSLWAGAGPDNLIRAYVTVRDEGGAALPENLFGPRYNLGANWLRLLIITTGDGVKLRISAGALGQRQSGHVAEYEGNIAGAFQGTEISFRFWGEEERARGEIAEAYRYYYDITDDPTSAWNYWTSTEPIRQRGADPEWIVRYPTDGSQFAPSLGRHVFVVELRDVNEVITHCEFNIEVLEGPRRIPPEDRKILLVDDDHADYMENRWPLFEEEQEAFWADILDGYAYDRFSTGETNYKYKVPVRFVGLATTVIWLADDESSGSILTQLLKTCTEYGNYLHSYVKVGGNLIIIGRDPIRACAYWPDWQDRPPNPSNRQNFVELNFTPRYDSANDDTMYNFNWEVFGIERMLVPAAEIPFNRMMPGLAGGAAWQDTIDAIPPIGRYWSGEFNTAFSIKEIRQETDSRFPLYVEPMYRTAYYDTLDGGTDVGDLIAVYVPGDDRRGHAAYIGFPGYWFDHDKVKAMIRELLDRFGEYPQGQ